MMLVMFCVSISACAEQEIKIEKNISEPNNKKDISIQNHKHENVQLLHSGDIFIKNNETSANYFSTEPIASEKLAKRLTWVLQQMNASLRIINFSKSRLPTNRRLKKDNFILPLTDEDGTIYQFIYTSDIEAKFYSIYYEKR